MLEVNECSYSEIGQLRDKNSYIAFLEMPHSTHTHAHTVCTAGIDTKMLNV